MKAGSDAEERLVRGQGDFLADLELDALEACFVRSPYPHARVQSISLPGGRGLTGAQLARLAGPLRVDGPGLKAVPWWPLAVEKVRFVGEAVAVVWAEDRYLAEDLADETEVDYEPIPAGPLHEEAPDGVLYESRREGGDFEAAFGRAARVLERTFKTARQTPLPLEARGVVARWDGAAGRLTVWTSTQVPNLVRTVLASSLQLAEGDVRVIVPVVGGGFGLKAHVFPEELAVAALARHLDRTVRWVEDRRENLLASAHAHEETVRLRLALDDQGRFLAVDAEVSCDVGAYSVFPFSASLEPVTTGQTLFGPYALEAFRLHASGLASSKCPAGAYRGVGMNAAAFATERMVDIAARELGLDPLELRRRNAIREFPTVTAAGRELDSGDYLGLLGRLDAPYRELRRQQAEARREGRLFGIGVGFFNEHSGTGASEYQTRGITTIPGVDSARVRVGEDGTIEIATGGADAGQGHAETYRLLAARELGVAAEKVVVFEGDTDACPPGSGTFVSRGAVGGLTALTEALREVAEKDLAPGLEVTRVVDPKQVFPSGAHLAAVEVDPLGLNPRVIRYLAVEDCGVVVNERAAEAQVRGGVAMGMGGVLLEEIRYSEDGQPLASTLLDYLVPLAPDVPEIEIEHQESPSPLTALGSKGVGEAGTIGAFAAVANAVADAVQAELNELPCSPDRIFHLRRS